MRWGWGCQTRNGSTHDYIVDREQRLHTQSECSPGVQSTTPSHVPYRTVRRGPGCSDQCVQKPNKRDREESTFKFAGHAHYNNVHCRARGRTSNIQFGASWYGTANPSQFASGRSHSTPLTALRVIVRVRVCQKGTALVPLDIVTLVIDGEVSLWRCMEI